MRKFDVGGMTCAVCSARVEKTVSALSGVASCSVSLLTASMVVEGDASDKEIISAVKKAGYTCKVSGGADKGEDKSHDQVRLIRRLAASVCLLLPLMYISMGGMLGLPLGALEGRYMLLGIIQAVLSLAVLSVNARFFISGTRAILKLSPNMDTLVALGSGASYLYSLVRVIEMLLDAAHREHYYHDLYFEAAAMILTLITVGKMLEAYAKGKTTDAIKSLMKLAPSTARVLRDGRELEIDVKELALGDILVIRGGESIAADGEIIEGECSVDESALTGESMPVDKHKGDSLFCATINKSGYVKCRVTALGEQTALSAIIKMVADAASTKAPIAKIADRIAGVFVPAVMAIAAVTIAVWAIITGELGYALERGVSVLVISCPCALGLATPVAIMVGSGIAARSGILFKTAAALEKCAEVKTVLLDKTGTITEGALSVTDIIPIGVERYKLLEYAYGVEIGSEHPLARAIVNYCSQNGVNLPTTTGFESYTGSGVYASVCGVGVYGGSYGFYRKSAADDRLSEHFYRLSSEGKTPLFFFGEGGEIYGIIALADIVKADSAQAISALSRRGVRVIMLTGDNERTAEAIAESVGCDEVRASLLPDGKESAVKELSADGAVMMIGDGINDAPALARADVGVAIGRGVDIAIDSADVVLMRSGLSDAVTMLDISRATLKNIKENLFWAFFYNCLFIPVAMGVFVPLGLELSPMLGALAMSLSSLFVVGNALRLNLKKFNKML
ncbi:MAG: copper-translocating P-type ATPase [Clostridia bacterium]|nr:copper-translocating P-type ATPase [Clostridia bacterium]